MWFSFVFRIELKTGFCYDSRFLLWQIVKNRYKNEMLKNRVFCNLYLEIIHKLLQKKSQLAISLQKCM